jgi:magnesium-transporting ATPase (P-type)
MIPAISFAYENSEMNIMQRNPRDSKRDHLVNAKLISFSYLQSGIIQAAAGIFTYFYCLNDFGIRPATLFGLSGIKARLPNKDDVYKTFDDYQVFSNGSSLLLSKNGNTNYGNLLSPL